jgi:hypothetical protein
MTGLLLIISSLCCLVHAGWSRIFRELLGQHLVSVYMSLRPVIGCLSIQLSVQTNFLLHGRISYIVQIKRIRHTNIALHLSVGYIEMYKLIICPTHIIKLLDIWWTPQASHIIKALLRELLYILGGINCNVPPLRGQARLHLAAFLWHRLLSQTHTSIFCAFYSHSCAPGKDFSVGHPS